MYTKHVLIKQNKFALKKIFVKRMFEMQPNFTAMKTKGRLNYSVVNMKMWDN